MRIMIVDSVYEGYVQWLYKTSPGLNDMSYREQHDATVKGGFHTAAVWADPLREMGHDVMDVWGNHAPLQVRWCLENGHENILKMNSCFLRESFKNLIVLDYISFKCVAVAM